MAVISLGTVGETLWRASIGFAALLVIARLLGVKLLGQMTFFTYITGIAMGNMASEFVIHPDIAATRGISGIAGWGALTFIVEYISLKSGKARVLLDSEPSIVIKKGVIQRKTLSKLRLNMDDLLMLLRNSDIFSIREVHYAILEPNGQISVMKKEPDPGKYLPTELIVDGRIVASTIKELGLTESWLHDQLRKLGYKSFKEVFFAELQSDGSVYVAQSEQK